MSKPPKQGAPENASLDDLLSPDVKIEGIDQNIARAAWDLLQRERESLYYTLFRGPRNDFSSEQNQLSDIPQAHFYIEVLEQHEGPIVPNEALCEFILVQDEHAHLYILQDQDLLRLKGGGERLTPNQLDNLLAQIVIATRMHVEMEPDGGDLKKTIKGFRDDIEIVTRH